MDGQKGEKGDRGERGEQGPPGDPSPTPALMLTFASRLEQVEALQLKLADELAKPLRIQTLNPDGTVHQDVSARLGDMVRLKPIPMPSKP
jgi:hypothetical protein